MFANAAFVVFGTLKAEMCRCDVINVNFRKQSQKSSVDNDGNDDDADFRDKDEDDEVNEPRPRKPVFGVSDQVLHKPGCTTTEEG